MTIYIDIAKALNTVFAVVRRQVHAKLKGDVCYSGWGSTAINFQHVFAEWNIIYIIVEYNHGIECCVSLLPSGRHAHLEQALSEWHGSPPT